MGYHTHGPGIEVENDRAMFAIKLGPENPLGCEDDDRLIRWVKVYWNVQF